MADEIFEHPRLIAIYDALDPDRGDLDVYAAVAEGLASAGFWTSAAGPARSPRYSPTGVSK